MPDVVLRTKAEDSKPEVLPEGKTPSRSGDEGKAVESPYLDYESQNNHPHSVDYFGLGSSWDDPEGGFGEEIGQIESYIKGKIEGGDIANTQRAVKDFLKGIEKITGVKDEDRPLVKIETIAAYIKFLAETDEIKHNVKRYGKLSKWG